MKLKASGVIEPDFKIKEGKKFKDNIGDSPSKNYERQNRLTKNDRKKKKNPEHNNRAAYMAYMMKQESSLDSDDTLKRKRGQSIDSDDVDVQDQIMFRP